MSLTQPNKLYICIRPLIKLIIRKLFGTCELERAAINNNYQILQYSIKMSKKLSAIKQKIFIKQYTKDDYEQLFALKNIQNQKNKTLIQIMIKNITNLFSTIQIVTNIQKVKYSKQNNQHQNQLLELWNILKPNQPLKSRLSKQWIDIGFQDQDPSTDFRGAGYLGLLNLVNYAKTKQGIKCFQTASRKQSEFFFCSAGLFVTLTTSGWLKQRRFDNIFYTGDKDGEQFFQEMYNRIFNEFHIFWNECNDKSMMSFNRNLQSFKKKLGQRQYIFQVNKGS